MFGHYFTGWSSNSKHRDFGWSFIYHNIILEDTEEFEEKDSGKNTE